MAGLEGSVTALATFMPINSITPGPNNLMLLQGGLKRGYWGCRWHMLGISVGVTVMLWLSYWGMASLVIDHPMLMLIIRVLGSGYLLWLAYHMAKSDFIAIIQEALQADYKGAISKQTVSKQISSKQHFGELPLTFWQAVVF